MSAKDTVVITYLLVVGVVNECRVARLPLDHVKDESSSLLVRQVVMFFVLLWLHFKLILIHLSLQHLFETIINVFTSDPVKIDLPNHREHRSKPGRESLRAEVPSHWASFL